eukprot:Colp12_sorted_trinity150504_noHs@2062
MIQNNYGGVIINVASMGGLFPMPFAAVYSASKHGVVGFSRSLGHLSTNGIRVNCICPAFTATPLVMDNLEKSNGFKAATDALGIMKVEDVVDGILKLIEDEGAAGAVLTVTRKGAHYQKFPGEEPRKAKL